MMPRAIQPWLWGVVAALLVSYPAAAYPLAAVAMAGLFGDR